jgi:hypothetical protein
MKKIVATILAFIYLSTSMGATIHLHYCMGKLASWGLIDHESKNCAKCGMLKKTTSAHGINAGMNCCKDEHKQIKTDNDQKLSLAESFKYNVVSQSGLLHEPAVQGIRFFSVSIEYPNTNAPPLSDKLPLFVVYRNFRL